MSTFDKDDTFLARWLNGELTDTERTAFEKSTEYENFRVIAEESKKVKAPAYQKEAAWQRLRKATVDQPKEQATRRLFSWRAIAAVFALLLLAGGAWLRTGQTTINTLAQQKQEIHLPDGSTVVLNSLSTLKYNSRLWNWQRQIELEGEGYFDVTKGAAFSVNTPNGKVQVLGTSFNVYVRRGNFDVYCLSGSVEVKPNGGYPQHILTPYEYIRIRNGSGIKNTFSDATAPDWQKGQTSYQSVQLRRVLNDLEDQFDIRIDRTRIDVTRPFTGVFLHESVDLALEMVLVPMEIRYERKGQEVRTR